MEFIKNQQVEIVETPSMPEPQLSWSEHLYKRIGQTP